MSIIIVDASNRKDETQEVLSDQWLSMPVLLDETDISSESYGVFATPTTLIVNGDGRIIFKHLGYTEGMERMLEKEVELLLERRPT